jgi:hypothetical protein
LSVAKNCLLTGLQEEIEAIVSTKDYGLVAAQHIDEGMQRAIKEENYRTWNRNERCHHGFDD